MVYDAVARHGGKMLSIDSFLEAMGTGRSGRPSCALQELAAGIGSGDRMPTLREAEEALIARALARAGGNQGIAASYLGISRQALNKRLSRRSGD